MTRWRNIPGHLGEYLPGETVPADGEYRCSTCTNVQHFKAGQSFSECGICKGMVRSWCKKKKQAKTKGKNRTNDSNT